MVYNQSLKAMKKSIIIKCSIFLTSICLPGLVESQTFETLMPKSKAAWDKFVTDFNSQNGLEGVRQSFESNTTYQNQIESLAQSNLKAELTAKGLTTSNADPLFMENRLSFYRALASETIFNEQILPNLRTRVGGLNDFYKTALVELKSLGYDAYLVNDPNLVSYNSKLPTDLIIKGAASGTTASNLSKYIAAVKTKWNNDIGISVEKTYFRSAKVYGVFYDDHRLGALSPIEWFTVDQKNQFTWKTIVHEVNIHGKTFYDMSNGKFNIGAFKVYANTASKFLGNNSYGKGGFQGDEVFAFLQSTKGMLLGNSSDNLLKTATVQARMAIATGSFLVQFQTNFSTGNYRVDSAANHGVGKGTVVMVPGVGQLYISDLPYDPSNVSFAKSLSDGVDRALPQIASKVEISLGKADEMIKLGVTSGTLTSAQKSLYYDVIKDANYTARNELGSPPILDDTPVLTFRQRLGNAILRTVGVSAFSVEATSLDFVTPVDGFPDVAMNATSSQKARLMDLTSVFSSDQPLTLDELKSLDVTKINHSTGQIQNFLASVPEFKAIAKGGLVLGMVDLVDGIIKGDFANRLITQGLMLAGFAAVALFVPAPIVGAVVALTIPLGVMHAFDQITSWFDPNVIKGNYVTKDEYMNALSNPKVVRVNSSGTTEFVTDGSVPNVFSPTGACLSNACNDVLWVESTIIDVPVAIGQQAISNYANNGSLNYTAAEIFTIHSDLGAKAEYLAKEYYAKYGNTPYANLPPDGKAKHDELMGIYNQQKGLKALYNTILDGESNISIGLATKYGCVDSNLCYMNENLKLVGMDDIFDIRLTDLNGVASDLKGYSLFDQSLMTQAEATGVFADAVSANLTLRAPASPDGVLDFINFIVSDPTKQMTTDFSSSLYGVQSKANVLACLPDSQYLADSSSLGGTATPTTTAPLTKAESDKLGSALVGNGQVLKQISINGKPYYLVKLPPDQGGFTIHVPVTN